MTMNMKTRECKFFLRKIAACPKFESKNLKYDLKNLNIPWKLKIWHIRNSGHPVLRQLIVSLM